MNRIVKIKKYHDIIQDMMKHCIPLYHFRNEKSDDDTMVINTKSTLFNCKALRN